jgi:hypothetical protein
METDEKGLKLQGLLLSPSKRNSVFNIKLQTMAKYTR